MSGWSNPNPNPNDTDIINKNTSETIVCQLGEKSNPQQWIFNVRDEDLRINDDSFHMHIIGEESSVMSDGHEEDLDDDKCRVSYYVDQRVLNSQIVCIILMMCADAATIVNCYLLLLQIIYNSSIPTS
jgi:hypothetical protein